MTTINSSNMQKVMDQSNSLYEKVVSPMYTKTKDSAVNPSVSIATEDTYLAEIERLYQA